MTDDKEIFVEINAFKILKSNWKTMLLSKRREDVQLLLRHKMEKDVMLVMDMYQNFLSVGQLVDHGYMFVFGDNHCTIYDKNNIN